MVRFEATAELLICLGLALLGGGLVGFGLDSFLAGVAATVGFFCWFIDVLFSYEMQFESEDDDVSDF